MSDTWTPVPWTVDEVLGILWQWNSTTAQAFYDDRSTLLQFVDWLNANVSTMSDSHLTTLAGEYLNKGENAALAHIGR